MGQRMSSRRSRSAQRYIEQHWNEGNGNAPQERPRKKPRGLWLAVVLGVVVLGLGGWQVYERVIVPAQLYQQATTLLQQRDSDSIVLFQQLAAQDYRDSRDRLQEAMLNHVLVLSERGKCDEAQTYLDGMTGLDEETRTQYGLEITYYRAIALQEAAQYEQAIALFTALPDMYERNSRLEYCTAMHQLALAEELAERYDYEQAIALLRTMAEFGDAQTRIARYEQLLQADLDTLQQSAQGLLGAGAWYTLAGGDTPTLTATREQGIYLPEETRPGKVVSGLFQALLVHEDGTVSAVGSDLGQGEALAGAKDVRDAAVGWNHMLLLLRDGSVTALGDDFADKLAVTQWSGVTDVAAGLYHSVGLLGDGRVVGCGSDDDGQLQLSDWTQITQLAAGLKHTVGLRSDGTVVACGDNTLGQCDVQGWQNVRVVYASGNNTYALTADGHVLACGDNSAGQCNTEAFNNIVTLGCGMWHVVGLRRDGTLCFAGSNAQQQDDFTAFSLLHDRTAMQSTPSVQTSQTAAEVVWGLETEQGPFVYVGPDIAVEIHFTRIGGDHSSYKSDLRLTQNSLPYNVFSYDDTDGGKPSMPAVNARQHQTVFGQTGDYVTYRGNQKGVMIHAGRVYHDAAKAPTMVVTKTGEMVVYEPGETNAEALLAAGITESWAFGPILVKDSQVHKDVRNHYLHRGNFRGALGMIAPYHFISSVTNAMGSPTLTLLAEELVKYGCSVAYNLDGGNSCGFTFMGEQISKHVWNPSAGIGQRSMPDLLHFGSSALVPSVDDPYVRDTNIMNYPA